MGQQRTAAAKAAVSPVIYGTTEVVPFPKTMRQNHVGIPGEFVAALAKTPSSEPTLRTKRARVGHPLIADR